MVGLASSAKLCHEIWDLSHLLGHSIVYLCMSSYDCLWLTAGRAFCASLPTLDHLNHSSCSIVSGRGPPRLSLLVRIQVGF